MGANPQQTLQAFREAEAYEGPSLILAYSHCIAHGFDLRYGMKQQDLATASGYWPLFRYNPAMREVGERSVPAGFAAADRSVQGLCLQRAALSGPGAYAAGGGRGRCCARRRPTSTRNTAATRNSRASKAGRRRRRLQRRSRKLWKAATAGTREHDAMDLTTRYLGLDLRNPLVAGAGPLTGKLDNIRRLEDLGAGAVVLPSIFEEQIEQEQQTDRASDHHRIDSYAEALTYFPAPDGLCHRSRALSRTVQRRRQGGRYPGHRQPQRHHRPGLDRLCPPDRGGRRERARAQHLFHSLRPRLSGREVEQRYIDILKAVKRAVKIPVAVKIGPYFSAIGHMAASSTRRAPTVWCCSTGSTSRISISRGSPCCAISSSAPRQEIRLPLLWIGVLSGRIRASLAASTGVKSADEVIKYLLAGADVVMTTSALLRHGVGHMKVLLDGLRNWLAARDVGTLDQIRGRMSQRSLADPMAVERANYIRILQSYRPNR